MSKKKSLGSSPMDHKTNSTSSMSFIPDLGISKSNKKRQKKMSKSDNGTAIRNKTKSEYKTKKKSKKIVSYNLEQDLITKVKRVATKKDMYYSSFVSMVLEEWMAENIGFQNHSE